MTERTYSPRIGPSAFEVLKAIGDHANGLKADEVKQLGLFTHSTGHIHALDALANAGYITQLVRAKLWRITRPGRAYVAYRAKPAAKPKAPMVTGSVALPRRISPMVGTYTCPELTTNPHRPGSTDAARIPSVFAGQRVPRGAAA